MTTATAAIPAIVASTAPQAATELREPSASPHSFDRQLDAARQQHGPRHEPVHEVVHASPREPAHAPARKATGQAADRPAQQPVGSSKSRPVPDSSQAASDDGTGTPVSAQVPADAGLPSTAIVADGDRDAARDDAAADGDQAASVLAGSMLALLGLSAGMALGASGGKAAAASADNTAAGESGNVDVGAAASLQANGVDADAALVGALAAGGDIPLSDGDAKRAVEKPDAPGNPAAGVALPAPAITAAPAGLHQLQVQVPVESRAFAHELGQQVVWLGGQEIKQARIRLHPEDLGPLDVKVSVTHDRVDVVFSAQHPAAVTAVQQSLPQLGQLLAQQGLSLGQAQVGQQDRGHSQGRSGTAADAAVDDIEEIHGSTVRAVAGTVSLLDAFA